MRCVHVRNGKGQKDRIVTLADSLIPYLQAHLDKVRLQHDEDKAHGNSDVWLPDALAKKYPNGSGSTFFPAPGSAVIPVPASGVGIMCTNERFSAQ